MGPTTTGERTDTRAVAGVVWAVVAWGFGPIFVKLIVMPGLTLAMYRLWLGFALMVVLALVSGRRILWSEMPVATFAGALFGINVAFFFTSLKHTSVADASLITALAPVLILVVAGRMFGERPGARDYLLTAVVIGGVALVVVGASGRPEWSAFGDLLAVGALVSWAAYFVATKRARATLGTLQYQTGVLLGAALVVTPIALIARTPIVAPRGDDWFWLGMFVLVPGAIGHLLMSWSHRYVDVSLSSLIVVAQPVVSALAAAVVLHEGLDGLQLLGGAVVLAGIAAVVHGHRRIEDDLLLEEAPR